MTHKQLTERIQTYTRWIEEMVRVDSDFYRRDIQDMEQHRDRLADERYAKWRALRKKAAQNNTPWA